jgi:putative membrane protein
MSEPDPQRPSESDDVDRRTTLAGERTSLAVERTLLAWWRTGLTAVAVALGVGRLLPELAPHADHFPFAALGIGFALYGIAFFVLGTRRLGVFDRRTWAASGRASEDRMLVAFMGGGVILGLGTLVLILSQ